MYLYRFLFILLIVNISFSKNEKTMHSSTTPDHGKIWKAEDENVKNPELKKALDKLRNEFESERSDIQNAYKVKIKDLKKNKDKELDKLKKDFQSKRISLKEKYGFEANKKPRNLKANKKDKTQITKPSKIKQSLPEVNKLTPNKSKVEKTTSKKIDEKEVKK